MPIAAQCHACGRRLRVPSQYAGRRVTCTKCGAAVPVGKEPVPASEVEKKKTPVALPPPPAASPLPEPHTFSDRLGITALALGLVSILIFCLPYARYGAILFSGVGLLLGITGLLDVLAKGLRQRASMSSAGSLSSLSITAAGYPCGGTATCLIALLLALAPYAHR